MQYIQLFQVVMRILGQLRLITGYNYNTRGLLYRINSMKNRTLLMIPGPVEFEPAVMAAMGEPTTSHLASAFIEAFGQALQDMRPVFGSSSGQPLVLAGSGTLAMDCAGANLVEPGDKALVVDTGYFSERFSLILERYGALVTRLTTTPGNRPALEQVKAALE